MVEVGHQQLGHMVIAGHRAGYFCQDRLEQGGQVGVAITDFVVGQPGLGIGIYDGELDLLVGGIEVDKQVVDLTDHSLDAGVAAVDLVDHQDNGEVFGQRLFQDVPGLRQGAFAGVHQQQGAVHQVQAALHLAGEIGVPGRVHDVDLHLVVPHGGVLGRYGDPPLALQVKGIHDPVGYLLVLAKGAALPQQAVQQGGFAMIHMGDNGDIPEVALAHQLSLITALPVRRCGSMRCGLGGS